MTTCIGCACTDDEACDGGCYWVAKGPADLAGACSECMQAGIIPLRGNELAQELFDAELEMADQPEQDYSFIDRDPRLILPDHPEFQGTLQRMRR